MHSKDALNLVDFQTTAHQPHSPVKLLMRFTANGTLYLVRADATLAPQAIKRKQEKGANVEQAE